MNQNRRYWLWIVAAAILLALTVIGFWLDPAVQHWVGQHQNKYGLAVMRNVSRFGDWLEHVVVGLLLLGAAWMRGNKKWTRVFLAMLIACALAGLAARVVKVAAGRARPSVKTTAIWNGPRWSEKYHAFPSGHVAASMGFFAVLLFVNWRIGLACLPIPLLVAVSRMYVAAHYLSDVLFAALLGAICAAVVSRFLKIPLEEE